MARTSNEKYREAKKVKILNAARFVFCRKGYLNTTMQDIVDECKISRGGIYLYFSSVDEIFREVAARRNKAKFAVIYKAAEENKPFASVLGDYMALQKERLLHMENSLLRAMYEYNFSGAEGAARTFRSTQLDNLRNSVQTILALGINQKVIHNQDIKKIIDHFIVVIEGLSVLALTEVLTETIVDEQFAILNDLVNSIAVRNEEGRLE